MAEILVTPPELRTTAGNLRADAKIIQNAIDAVDSDIKQLGPASFEGVRADTLRARYNKLREAIYSFPPLINNFANELDDAATRFTAADNNK